MIILDETCDVSLIKALYSDYDVQVLGANCIVLPGIIDVCVEFNPSIESLPDFTYIAAKGGVTTLLLDKKQIQH